MTGQDETSFPNQDKMSFPKIRTKSGRGRHLPNQERRGRTGQERTGQNVIS